MNARNFVPASPTISVSEFLSLLESAYPKADPEIIVFLARQRLNRLFPGWINPYEYESIESLLGLQKEIGWADVEDMIRRPVSLAVVQRVIDGTGGFINIYLQDVIMELVRVFKKDTTAAINIWKLVNQRFPSQVVSILHNLSFLEDPAHLKWALNLIPQKTKDVRAWLTDLFEDVNQVKDKKNILAQKTYRLAERVAWKCYIQENMKNYKEVKYPWIFHRLHKSVPSAYEWQNYCQLERKFEASLSIDTLFSTKVWWKTKNLTARFLPRKTKKGLLLGRLTGCCQHLKGAGRDCAWHGQTSPNGGFFVVQKGARIVAQSWVYETEKGIMFDSIEGYSSLVKVFHDEIMELYRQATKAIGEAKNKVVCVAESQSKISTKPLRLIKEKLHLGKPDGYFGYTDSNGEGYCVFHPQEKRLMEVLELKSMAQDFEYAMMYHMDVAEDDIQSYDPDTSWEGTERLKGLNQRWNKYRMTYGSIWKTVDQDLATLPYLKEIRWVKEILDIDRNIPPRQCRIDA